MFNRPQTIHLSRFLAQNPGSEEVKHMIICADSKGSATPLAVQSAECKDGIEDSSPHNAAARRMLGIKDGLVPNKKFMLL